MAGGFGRLAGGGLGRCRRGCRLRRFRVSGTCGLCPGAGTPGIAVPVPVPAPVLVEVAVPVPVSSSSAGSAAADSAPGRVGAWGSVYSGWWTGRPAAAQSPQQRQARRPSRRAHRGPAQRGRGGVCLRRRGGLGPLGLPLGIARGARCFRGGLGARLDGRPRWPLRARSPRGQPWPPGRASGSGAGAASGAAIAAPAAPAVGPAAPAAAGPTGLAAAVELAAEPLAAPDTGVEPAGLPEECRRVPVLVPAADEESAPGRLLLRFSSRQTTATTTMMTTSQTIQSIAEPFSPYSAHEAWLPMLDVTSGQSRLSTLPAAKCRAFLERIPGPVSNPEPEPNPARRVASPHGFQATADTA